MSGNLKTAECKMAVFENLGVVNKVILDDTQRLSCVIEAAENAQDHTVYLMRVQRGPLIDNSWQVWRRYSDFVTLHGYLQGSGLDIQLPPKKVFGKMEREFIAERQQGLQNYVNAVLEHPMVSQCLPLKRFLDPHNYDANFLEQSLQHVSMVFRSESNWEVVEPLSELGWRLRKHYFLVKPKTDPKDKLLLFRVPFGPDKFLEDKDLQQATKLLSTVQHPNLCPTVYSGATENGGVVIRTFYPSGSLRDIICKCKPRGSFVKKYTKVKSPCTLRPEDIRKFARQILVVLKFLHDKGLAHGHLHSGNVVIEDGRCQLLDLENYLFGIPSFLRPYFVQLRKVQTMENIDVYCFGHLLYEMVFGSQCDTPTCDNFPPSCPAELRSVLEAILTTEACKNGLPTISNLLLHPFFSKSKGLETEPKVSLKLPSQMKENLKKAKEQLEHRLREEQKILRHSNRISRVQAQLNSVDHRKKRQHQRQQQQQQQKQQHENHSSSGASNGPTPSPTPPTPSESLRTCSVSTTPSTPNSTFPAAQPSGPPLPPPPPPPPPPPGSSPASSPASPSADRSALLGSIQGFNKLLLKKAETKDKSSPAL